MTMRFASVDLLPAHHRATAMRQMDSSTAADLRAHATAMGTHKPAPTPTPATRPRKPSRDAEHNEQVVVFNRIRTLALNDARYVVAARRTFAIPNGGGRTKREAGRLKAEGVLAGVSDIFCALPVGQFHGLWIEMKSLTGLPSREQKAWLAESFDLGYAAACCRGADEAMVVWKTYVDALP